VAEGVADDFVVDVFDQLHSAILKPGPSLLVSETG